MLDLNSLYNAVFTPEYRKFDPTEDYYTVLMDTPAFAPLYQEVLPKLKTMMNQQAFCYFHSETLEDLGHRATIERLSRVAETLSSYINVAPPARRFCVLSYFDDNCREIDALIQLLTTLPKSTKDIYMVVVCLSEWMKDRDQFLKELSESIWKNTPQMQLYLFTDNGTPYYRRVLVQSICGVVLMETNHTMNRSNLSKKNSVYTAVNRYISGNLSEEGRAAITQFVPVRWSTVCCRYYDRQSDFLHKYLSDVTGNVKQLDFKEFSSILKEVYRSRVPSKDTIEVARQLKAAVETIPYVVSTLPKNYSGKMSDYFTVLYGNNGLSTVDLTMKAMLSSIYRYNTNEVMAKCCQGVLEACASFAAENLHELICKYLQEYLDWLSAVCKEQKGFIHAILNDDYSFEGASFNTNDSFYESYIKLYEKQKEEALWVEVLRHLKIHADEYQSYYAKSASYYNDMEKLTRQINHNRVYQFETLESTPLTAEEILTMDQSVERCTQIRTLFSQIGDEKQQFGEPNSCEDVFQVPLDSHFYQTSPVRLETSSYTMCGCQYIGQYLVFIGGGNNV